MGRYAASRRLRPIGYACCVVVAFSCLQILSVFAFRSLPSSPTSLLCPSRSTSNSTPYSRRIYHDGCSWHAGSVPDTNRATANLRRLLMQQRALGPAAAATAAVVAPLPCSEHVHVLNGVGVTHGEKQRHVLCGLTMRKPTMRYSTALGAVGSGNSGMEQGERKGGGREGESWRQRVVRRFVTALTRIRAALAAILGRFRIGERRKPSNTSLFRAAGRNRGRAAAGGGRGGQGAKGKRKRGSLRRLDRKAALAVFSLMLLATMQMFSGKRIPTAAEVPMSKFLEVVEGKQAKNLVKNLKVARTGRITYLLDGKMSYTQPVMVQKFVQQALSKSGVAYTAARTPAAASGLMASFLPILYLLGVYFFIVKKGAGDMVGSTGKLASSSDLDRSLTFSDVAGVDEAKSQVQELVTMIKNPGPFLAAGARLPSGLLMVGPPGTGKTLMARVMASEAGVPFYYCSGSDFVEMFVGRGAARVRKLFEKAAKTAPCIVFLDELDALGKERSASAGGRQSNDEAEQTLNQLLASMDGLDTNNNGVMVIAATNRFDVLDSALTRPGRFDRVVRVEVPNTAGREAILKVHTRRMNLADSALLGSVAELTPGLTGAELATIVNEAAISAARRGSKTVNGEDLQSSVQNFYVSRNKGVGALQNMFKGMLS